MTLQKKSIAFFAFAILAFLGLSSCTNSISTVDTNLSLDLSPLSARMSALRSQDIVLEAEEAEDNVEIETYYLHCTAVNANDATKVYVDGKKIMSYESTDEKKTVTIQLINMPYGEKINFDVKIYRDSTYSDSSILAGGSTSFTITESENITLPLTVYTGSSTIDTTTPTNKDVTLEGTLGTTAIADTTKLAYKNTTDALVLTATCATATKDATYTWYVNGTAVTITDTDGSSAILTTTASGLADAASSVINIDGANTVTVTVTENGIIVGSAKMTLTYAL